jgi:hypothetical protein
MVVAGMRHRDATMILIGLHVRRTKNGSPSVHPMQGDEIRALRRLQVPSTLLAPADGVIE